MNGLHHYIDSDNKQIPKESKEGQAKLTILQQDPVSQWKVLTITNKTKNKKG